LWPSMLAVACLCLLLSQVNALPHEWQETVKENRNGESEPVYPPAPPAFPDSLLSVSEQQQMGAQLGLGAGAGAAAGFEQIPSFDPMIPGYIPTSSPFDNPSSSLSKLINTIPAFPDCNVRPQTVVEIQRMRESASKIAQMMTAETFIMNKRKAYVEQMTVYINDRIREINKVKSDLAQETRWLDLSSNRIAELEEREKLVKLQDVQSCLNDQTTRSQGDAAAVTKSLADIQSQASVVQSSISTIQARMAAINSNGASGGASGAASSTG